MLYAQNDMTRPSELRSDYPQDSGTIYQQEIVRDLFWLIRSPSLMELPDQLSVDWLFDTPEIEQQLALLDKNPEQLLSKLRQQARFRLGYYFEDLVRLYLKLFMHPTDIKCNIQVSRDKTTVGEYDFLMAMQDGIKIHLEAAVKYYLCTSDDPDTCQLKDFIGPNRSDRLDRKWQRLTTHQINLSNTDAGKDQAIALDLLPDRHSILLRGFLFYPHKQWQQYQAPTPISPNHLRGWWLRTSELEKLNQDSRYVVLMKPRWLAMAQCNFQETISFTELIKTTDSITTPLLIARLEFDLNKKLWLEVDRGFTVPDNWNLQA
jgi:hypothetical protein